MTALRTRETVQARKDAHTAAKADGEVRMCAKDLHDMYAGELLFTETGGVRCRECKALGRRKPERDPAPLTVVETIMDGWRELFPEGIRNLWRRGAEHWHDRGKCRTNPEVFYAPDTKDMAEFHRRNRAAKAICAGCDVRAQCLAYALEAQEDYGVWGGTTPAERRKILAEMEGVAA